MFSFRSKLLCTTGLALFAGSGAALAASSVAIGGKQLAPLPTAQPGGMQPMRRHGVQPLQPVQSLRGQEEDQGQSVQSVRRQPVRGRGLQSLQPVQSLRSQDQLTRARTIRPRTVGRS